MYLNFCTRNNNWYFVVSALPGITELFLKDERVDPSSSNNYTIRTASEKGYYKIVKLLLKDDRVDPSADNNYAIRLASKNGRLDVVELLLKDGRVDLVL